MSTEVLPAGNSRDTPISTMQSANQIAKNIKEIARRIREESAKMRDTVRIVHQSGAIDELTDAIREAVIAARDTSREINTGAKDLRERGVIKDTLTGLDTTVASAKDTAQVLRDMTEDAKQAAPNTAASISKGVDSIRQSATTAGQMVKEKLSWRTNEQAASI